jgi:hypothetical protein
VITYLFIALFALHALVAVQMYLLKLREPKNFAALHSAFANSVYATLFLMYIVVPEERLRNYVVLLVGLYVVLVPILASLIWCLKGRVFDDEN